VSPDTFQFGMWMAFGGVCVGLCLGAGGMALLVDWTMKRIAQDVKDAD
jgi:hypothetical protein